MSTAEFYLNMDRTEENKLYHEAHEYVAVMFASVVGLSFDEDNILTTLNEIICAFDKILFEPEFGCRIEKIKIAGMTYMAACGLESHRRDSTGDIMCPDMPLGDNVVKTMVKFAAQMMVVLDNYALFKAFKPYRYKEYKTRKLFLQL